MNRQNTDTNRRGVSAGKGEVINVRALLVRYLRYWYWFLFSVILALGVAVLYVKSTNTKYAVYTKFLLRNDDSGPGLPQIDMMESLGLGGGNRDVEDEMQVISSNKLIGQVIDSLDIHAKYFEKKKLKFIELYNTTPFAFDLPPQMLDTLTKVLELDIKEKKGKFRVKLKVRKEFKGKYVMNHLSEGFETPYGQIRFAQNGKIAPDAHFKVTLYPKHVIMDAYRNEIKVGTVNKMSSAIVLTLVESNIQKAKDILNTLVEFYNRDTNLDKNMIAEGTANFINDRLLIITDELFDVEQAVESYKKVNKLTDLSSEAEIFLQSASEYEKKQTELEIQLNMIRSVESYIANPENSKNLIPANVVTEDLTLAMAIQEYNTALLDLMKLRATASLSNPVLIQGEEQLKALRANVLASVKSTKNGLEIALNDLKRKDAVFASRIKGVPTQERQFLEIKRQQEIKQTLYLYLFQKKEENAIKLASTAPAARVLDVAYASLEPVAPKKSIIALVALVLGMLVPFVWIYLKDMLNNKIEDTKQYQALVAPPFLGNIPISTGRERMVVREGETTPVVEMFRLLRTNLQFLISDSKSPVILLTSTISGEGKTFIAMNLAMSFALVKKRVVLVGLDIRNPILGEDLKVSNKNGVTIYLSDSSCKVDDIIHKAVNHPFLDVIAAGPIPPNPSELLQSDRLEKLFDELRTRYDYILVDTAPIGMVSDTYLLNRIADNTVFISRQKYTPQDATNLINEIYEENRLKGIGVVLNATPASTGYGYGYGYGRNVSNKPPRLSLADRFGLMFRKNS